MDPPKELDPNIPKKELDPNIREQLEKEWDPDISDAEARLKFEEYKRSHQEFKFEYLTYELFKKDICEKIEKKHKDKLLESFMYCLLEQHFINKYDAEIKRLQGIQPTNLKHKDLLNKKKREAQTKKDHLPIMLGEWFGLIGQQRRGPRGLPRRKVKKLEFLQVPQGGLKKEHKGEQGILNWCADCGYVSGSLQCQICGKLLGQDQLAAVHREQVEFRGGQYNLEQHDVETYVNRLTAGPYFPLLMEQVTNDKGEIEKLLWEYARQPDFNENIYKYKLEIAKKIVDILIEKGKELPFENLQNYMGRDQQARKKIWKHYNEKLRELEEK